MKKMLIIPLATIAVGGCVSPPDHSMMSDAKLCTYYAELHPNYKSEMELVQKEILTRGNKNFCDDYINKADVTVDQDVDVKVE